MNLIFLTLPFLARCIAVSSECADPTGLKSTTMLFTRGQKYVTNEQKLRSWLLDASREYDPKVAPPSFDEAGNMILHTNIEIQLELMGVMAVDKDASTVTFKAAFRQWWIDPRLSWKEEEFGGVDRLWMSSADKEVWLPDTIIREDAGGSYFSDFKETQVRIHSNGLHYWTRLGDLKVVASLDFTKYPYDIQQINMTIGSWLYNDQRITYNYWKNETSGKLTPLVIQNPDNWYTDNIEWDFYQNET